MNSKLPLISFLLPFYNGKDYVIESIESVKQQSYKNIELIVVDDASPDKQQSDYIQQLSKKYNFKLIKHHENLGCNQSLITAFKESTGEYISIIAQDDIVLPNKIEYMLGIIKKRDLEVLYCNGAYFTDKDTEHAIPFSTDTLFQAKKRAGQKGVADLYEGNDTIGCLLTQGALYKRHVWEQTLTFRRSFLIDDWPFTLKCWRDYKADFDAKVVYLYRIHKKNSHADSWKFLPGRVQVIAEMVTANKRLDALARALANTGLPLLQSDKLDGCCLLLAASILSSDPKEALAWKNTAIGQQHKPTDDPARLRQLKQIIRNQFSPMGWTKKQMKGIKPIYLLWKVLKTIFFFKKIGEIKKYFRNLRNARAFMKTINEMHASQLRSLRKKKKINVTFIAFDKATWKMGPIFEAMQADPFFEPLILVCPTSDYHELGMYDRMDEAYLYFSKQGYNTKEAYLSNTNSWLKINELSTDIVFFSNPHSLTYKYYYDDIFLNYLSCYIPYSHDVSKYNEYQSQYNQEFHNAMWKIFVPHDEDFKIYKRHSYAKAKNVHVTGYPFGELLLNNNSSNLGLPKKIIWAPHHTVDPNGDLIFSTFFKYAIFFKTLACELQKKVHFIFKPHPILKNKLYNHPQWGPKKTDEYYDFWESSGHTSLVDGDYINIFLYSDALIHDCGSFLAEYHYTHKPMLYLVAQNRDNYLNAFGIKAKESATIGTCEEDIQIFVEAVINNHAAINCAFYDNFIAKYFTETKPSQKIIAILKHEIWGV